MKINTVLHLRASVSNKVYVVSIVPKELNYSVVAKWGRIYKNMQSQVKGVCLSMLKAELLVGQLVDGKCRKGYVDIESSSYNGPLKMTDSWLRAFLEDGGAPPVKSVLSDHERTQTDDELKEKVRELLRKGQKIDALNAWRKETGVALAAAKVAVDKIEKEVPSLDKREFEVVCVDNIGLEDGFDDGATYVAERHSDSDMLWVYDRNAVKRECFGERFRVA